MRKADLVTRIAEETKVDKVDVLVTLEAFFTEVKKTLANGENVYVRGFGSFVVKKRNKKVGRDILQKKQVEIPEHFTPTFRASKSFADQVRENCVSLKGSQKDEE